MSYIKICNRVFKVINSSTKYNEIVKRITYGYYATLHDAYTKPSATKQDIYYDWISWQYDVHDTPNLTIMENIRIIGRNSSTFSLAMWLVIDNIYVVLHITADNNYAYVVANSCKIQLEKKYEA